jgi:hypothetical protein
MKIVILAERAANAGLTQDEAFPMMKNQRNLITTEAQRHGEVQIQEILCLSSP